MKTPIRPEAPRRLDCNMCLDQIPADITANAECAEYVFHLYGIDCYRRWKKGRPSASGKH